MLLGPGDVAFDPFNDNNHGTAVLGVLIADKDTKGVTGISWGANVGLAPAAQTARGNHPETAISLAMADGSPGDVILIELGIPVCGVSVPGGGPLEWGINRFSMRFRPPLLMDSL